MPLIGPFDFWRHAEACAFCTVVFGIVGCATPEPIELPTPRSLTAHFDSTPASNIAVLPRQDTRSEIALPAHRELTLEQAIVTALRRHPSLAAATFEVQARTEEYRQAGTLPNPELQTNFENFGGQGPYSGFGAAETTLSIGQLIELGGKRASREMVAASETQLAGWDLETKRIAVYREVTRLYIEALAAGRTVAIAEQLVLLAEQLLNTVDERVSAGKVSPIESQRAQIVVGRARAERSAFIAQKQAAFRSLGTSLGIRNDVTLSLTTPLHPVTASLPAASEVANFLCDNPDIARWATEIVARQAKLEYERAKRIPDVTVGAGVKRFEEFNDNALVATFSVPIPLFDRNQGAIGAARSRLAQDRAEADNARLTVELALEQAYSELSAAAAQALAMQDKLLPAAKATFESSQSAYREGKFDLVTLLDAQRTYFEIEMDAINATASYYLGRADVEALIGRDLSSIVGNGETNCESQ